MGKFWFSVFLDGLALYFVGEEVWVLFKECFVCAESGGCF